MDHPQVHIESEPLPIVVASQKFRRFNLDFIFELMRGAAGCAQPYALREYDPAIARSCSSTGTTRRFDAAVAPLIAMLRSTGASGDSVSRDTSAFSKCTPGAGADGLRTGNTKKWLRRDGLGIAIA